MPNLSDELASLYTQFVAGRSNESRESCRELDRRSVRKLKRLSKSGVVTVGDLLEHLPELSPDLKQFGIWLILVFRIRKAINVLLTMLPDKEMRWSCADAIGSLGANSKVTSIFLEIGRRELSAIQPDSSWLNAVVACLKSSFTPYAAEMLVTIFERRDLAGWVRGNAGNAIGCASVGTDRRTKLHRRCRDAAIHGLTEQNIEVQFWSMYVLSQLAASWQPRDRSNDELKAALPLLRQFASNDHRPSPGYWWPMSGEAEDTIHHITTGSRLEPEAAERWLASPVRGSQNFSEANNS